ANPGAQSLPDVLRRRTTSDADGSLNPRLKFSPRRAENPSGAPPAGPRQQPVKGVSMSRILVVLFLATLAAACTYSTASLDYAAHPELHAVRMWNVDHDPPGVTKLGLVQADRGGWKDCDAMATDVTLKLLNDARAMGGASVVE